MSTDKKEHRPYRRVCVFIFQSYKRICSFDTWLAFWVLQFINKFMEHILGADENTQNKNYEL